MTDLEQSVMFAVLRLNEGDRDGAYGVAVRDDLDALGQRKTLGAIYATLDRLEDRGFLSSRVGDATPKKGGRAKRFFKITESGRKSLAAALDMRRRVEQGARCTSEDTRLVVLALRFMAKHEGKLEQSQKAGTFVGREHARRAKQMNALADKLANG